VRHTTPLLMTLGGRLPERLSWLRRPVAEYIDEEIGHEEWILNDIAAAGGDADAVRASEPDLPAEVMVAYAYDLLNRGNPAASSAWFSSSKAPASLWPCRPPTASSRRWRCRTRPSPTCARTAPWTSSTPASRRPAGPDDAGRPGRVIHCSAGVFYQLYGDVFRTLPSRGDAPCS
jgi:hypothetical protein